MLPYCQVRNNTNGGIIVEWVVLEGYDPYPQFYTKRVLYEQNGVNQFENLTPYYLDGTRELSSLQDDVNNYTWFVRTELDGTIERDQACEIFVESSVSGDSVGYGQGMGIAVALLIAGMIITSFRFRSG